MTLKTAVYPGTFDPVTKGHIALILRALSVFERVHVVVAENSAKKCFFTSQERADLLRASLQGVQGASVHIHTGLLTDYLKQNQLTLVVRGLRGAEDIAYEQQVAQAYRRFYPLAETVFFMAREQEAFIRSSLVRAGILQGKIVPGSVPSVVEEELKKRNLVF